MYCSKFVVGVCCPLFKPLPIFKTKISLTWPLKILPFPSQNHSRSQILCFFWLCGWRNGGSGLSRYRMSENSGHPFINLSCAFIFYQPMKTFDFFLATRATRFRRKEKKRGALVTRMSQNGKNLYPEIDFCHFGKQAGKTQLIWEIWDQTVQNLLCFSYPK